MMFEIKKIARFINRPRVECQQGHTIGKCQNWGSSLVLGIKLASPFYVIVPETPFLGSMRLQELISLTRSRVALRMCAG